MKRFVGTILGLLLASCGSDSKGENSSGGVGVANGGDNGSANGSANGGANDAATSQPTNHPQASNDPFAAPASSFARQLELIRELDVDGLKQCVVAELVDKVELADLEDAKERMGSVPATDIAAKVEERGKYADLLQKSGAKLTTLVKIDGKWLSQDIWWKRSE